MRVHLSDIGAISLNAPLEFNRLDVVADHQDPAQLETAIARIGRRADEGHVWMAPAVLRFLSGHAGDSAWEESFSAMLAYAARNHWVDADGNVRGHLVMMPPTQAVDGATFKTAMRALPSGVSVVTTGTGSHAAGMVVSSLTSVSAQPPMVGFFVHRESSMHSPLLSHGRFAANVLGSRHRDVMATVLEANQGPARFASGHWSTGESGLPVLSDALASLECDIVCTHRLGTHDLVVGKVRRTVRTDAEPMVHFDARTRELRSATLPASECA